MDTKEIKSALKSAREAIRQKDFKEALRNCKAVLKADKDNYNALVFIGVAAEGLEQPDQAIKAYEKATAISPEQVLAWQGLCSFYEKSTTQENMQALVPVYEKLVMLYQGDKGKWMETIIKLAELHSKLGAVDRASACYHSALKDITEPEKQRVTWRKLADLLRPCKSLTPDQENMLLEAYKVMLTSGGSEEQQQYIQPYLELLKKREDYVELESESNRISSCYPSCAYPLEVLIQLELDSQIVSKQRSSEKAAALCERLITLGSQSSVLTLGEGFVSMISKDYTTAKALLSKGVKNCSSVIAGYVYLAEVLSCLFDYKGVVNTCEQALGKLKSKEKWLSCPNGFVENHLSLLTVKSYVSQGTELTLKKAVTTLEEMTSKTPDDQDILLLLADVYLKQGEITRVEELLKTHHDILTHAGDVSALKGRVAFARKEFPAAIKHLEQAVKEDGLRSEFYFQLGCVNWSVYKAADQTGQSAAEKSFKHWLQAAKLNPNNAEVFRCLGDFYATVQNDLMKAKRCYQKSFNLNPGDEKTGAALCDSLTATGEEEAAHTILLRVTSQASAGSGKWAWLRLGLYQVKNGDHTAAATSFQAALRADPSDNHVWECLAEAYLTRGSFTAALKAFTKALELDPSSLYCLYQISFIKQTLGQFTEAVAEYKAVLDTSPHYVPAMKGLGETLILLARSHLRQSFNLRAKDNCSEAIDYLTQAAAVRPDLSCLWKLLGDACTLLQPLSDKDFSVSVPLKLMEPGDKSGEKKKSLSKEELLQLGARCYGQALKLLSECAALWHDLGVNYFYQSQLLSGAAAVDMATKSLHILQKAVSLDPLDFRHWTALGRVACCPGVNKLSLAQHCFIKSILTERNNVVAWTNLGTLYLKNDNVKLAHDAFTVAQSLDPTYVACWIGQAMIAETVGHEDAMDLFRHTTELGHHLESSLGYGHWVCTVMRDLEKRDSEMYKYCIERMSAVPMASDALTRYLDRVKTNATAYNMYGLLLEKQGLLQSAAEAFRSAITILESESGSEKLITKARYNLARVLGNTGKLEDALTEYQSLGQELSFEGTCGLALVYYKLGQLAQSFQAYERALELATKDEDKSHVYAAMGMVAYRFGDADGVKTALFKCSQTTPSSNQGLAALCSFGFIQSDETLATAALEELLSRNCLNLLPQMLLLSAGLHVLQGDVSAAESVLTQALTDHPDNPAVKDLHASFLLRHVPEKCYLAAVSAKACRDTDVTYAKKSLVKQALGLLGCGNNSSLEAEGEHLDNLLRTAQKSYHLSPDKPDSVVSVISALHAEAVLTQDARRKTALLLTEMRFTAYLLQGTANLSPVYTWLVEIHVLALMLTNQAQEARQFISQMQNNEDNGRLKLLKEIVESFLSGERTKLAQIISQNEVSTFVWQLLAVLSTEESASPELVSGVYKGCLQAADSSGTTHRQTKFLPLIRMAQVAFEQMMKRGSCQDGWRSLFEESTEEVMKLEPNCSAVLLMKALLALKDNPRLSKHHLQQLLDNRKDNSCGAYIVSLARKIIIQILKETKKDPQALQDFLKDIEECGDLAVLDWYRTTYNDSEVPKASSDATRDYWDPE